LVSEFVLARVPDIAVGADDIDYKRLLRAACRQLDVAATELDNEAKLEKKLTEAYICRIESAPGFDKVEFERKLRESRDVSGASLAPVFATGGLMALLSSGGFGTYVAMSTVLSTAAGLVGVTLPFAAFMTASSALSIALGPVGWIALAICGLLVVGGDYQQKSKRSGEEDETLRLPSLCLWCIFWQQTRDTNAVPFDGTVTEDMHRHEESQISALRDESFFERVKAACELGNKQAMDERPLIRAKYQALIVADRASAEADLAIYRAKQQEKLAKLEERAKRAEAEAQAALAKAGITKVGSKYYFDKKL
jgi:hypothetical protein